MYKKIQQKNLKDPNSKLTSEDIENCHDIKVLFEWKMYIGSQIADADLQINAAKGKAASKGEYLDPEKYSKLLSYRRVMGFLHQRIQFQERLLKEETKEAPVEDHFPKIFMQCAKNILSEKKYESIIKKALEFGTSI